MNTFVISQTLIKHFFFKGTALYVFTTLLHFVLRALQSIAPYVFHNFRCPISVVWKYNDNKGFSISISISP